MGIRLDVGMGVGVRVAKVQDATTVGDVELGPVGSQGSQ